MSLPTIWASDPDAVVVEPDAGDAAQGVTDEQSLSAGVFNWLMKGLTTMLSGWYDPRDDSYYLRWNASNTGEFESNLVTATLETANELTITANGSAGFTVGAPDLNTGAAVAASNNDVEGDASIAAQVGDSDDNARAGVIYDTSLTQWVSALDRRYDADNWMRLDLRINGSNEPEARLVSRVGGVANIGVFYPEIIVAYDLRSRNFVSADLDDGFFYNNAGAATAQQDQYDTLLHLRLVDANDCTVTPGIDSDGGLKYTIDNSAGGARTVYFVAEKPPVALGRLPATDASVNDPTYNRSTADLRLLGAMLEVRAINGTGHAIGLREVYRDRDTSTNSMNGREVNVLAGASVAATDDDTLIPMVISTADVQAGGYFMVTVTLDDSSDIVVRDLILTLGKKVVE